MSDLAKELGSGTLTSEQVDAITHAWLDLRGSIEHFEASSFVVGAGDLEAACKDSVQDLEEAFPFLLEGKLKMSNISYDFAIDNIIAVDAPMGTDPDTLIEQCQGEAH